jgi:hypothetical protein
MVLKVENKIKNKKDLIKFMNEDIELFELEFIFHKRLFIDDYLECLVYAFNKKCFYDNFIYYSIIKLNLFNCFTYLINNHYDTPKDILIYICKYNRFNFLIYYFKFHKKFKIKLCKNCLYFSIKNDNEDLFQYLLSKKCPYDKRLLNFCIKNNYIEYYDVLIEHKKFKFNNIFKFNLKIFY